MQVNKIKNPAFIKVISFFTWNNFNAEKINHILNKLLVLKEDNKVFSKIKINDDFFLKIKKNKEIDYYTIEFWLVSNKDDFEIDLEEWKKIFNTLKLSLNWTKFEKKVFSSKNYILSETNLWLKFADKLHYDIEFKKEWNYRYIYPSWLSKELIPEFFAHISKIEIYYARILSLYKTFFIHFPEIKESNTDLIKEYSSIVEEDDIKVTKEHILKLNKKINHLEWINFGISYDLESIENNFENISWRLKSIWAEEARYFETLIEKINFIKNSFWRSFRKNKLVKENIASNYLTFLNNSLEKEKLEQEAKKINHIKNIKEILWGLAFVEIFIQWLSESTEIFNYSENLVNILTNTWFMRMSLILLFVVWYFGWYFGKYIIKKYEN